MGQDAQFDLAVVRVGQQPAGLRGEELPQAAAQLGAHRDVLQIRLGGADAAGAGLGLDKGAVHPAVRPQLPQQPLHIGAVQLLVYPVLQDIFDHRMITPQAFQGLRVGGVAALGLFAGRQAQLVKQRLAQLLGAVQVELVPHSLPDAGKAGVQLGFQGLAKSFQTRPVQLHPVPLHVRQHPGQRQLDGAQQLVHAVGGHLGLQRLAQAGQYPCVGAFFAHKSGRHPVFGGQMAHRVFAGGGVQQIGGQLAVKGDGPALAARVQRDVVEGLGVKYPQFRLPIQQGGQAAFFHRVRRAVGHGIPALLAPGQIHRAGQGFGQGREAGRRNFRRRGGGGSARLGQAQTADHAVHLQIGQ